MGHEVTVFHLPAKFPRVLYWIGKSFYHILNTRLGVTVPTERPVNTEYVADGVKVKRICISKNVPHALPSKAQLNKVLQEIDLEIKRNGTPDMFIGHWDIPQLQLLPELKRIYNRPVSLVFHSNNFTLIEKYGDNAIQLLKQLDYIGFRNVFSQKDFENKYFMPKHSFIAYSGVSETFIDTGNQHNLDVTQPINQVIFVGTLFRRKHPQEVALALHNNFSDKPWHLTYVGIGKEKAAIESFAKQNGISTHIGFTGWLKRENIISHLQKSQIFVMISENEVFGLVYLEAMALGLITIGSRNEGIDGIIQDGVNGFLCESGNVEELSNILQKINHMTPEQLTAISNNAKKTALEHSDAKAAQAYIEAISH